MGLGLIASIIVGGFAGWIGSRVMGANTGLFLNIILGIVGAIVANFILAALGIYAAEAWVPQLIVGIFGAIILIGAGRAFAR